MSTFDLLRTLLQAEADETNVMMVAWQPTPGVWSVASQVHPDAPTNPELVAYPAGKEAA